MIDDIIKTQALLDEMNAHLPLPVYAGRPLIRLLKAQGVALTQTTPLQIDHVFYAEDEGGIMCGLSGLHEKGVAFVCSLTHLRLPPEHPLTKTMQAYQRRRKNALKQQEAFGLAHSTLYPKKFHIHLGHGQDAACSGNLDVKI